VQGHCAGIASQVHSVDPISFMDGYGNVEWLPSGSWRRVSIWDIDGKEIALALVKLWEASEPTHRYDYIESVKAEWNGVNGHPEQHMA